MKRHAVSFVGWLVVLVAILVLLRLPKAINAETGGGSQSAAPNAIAGGTTSTVAFYSATLGKNLDYIVYLPAGYGTSGTRYPVMYLLHGRGGSMSSWLTMKATFDEMIATRQIPPTIFIMPDAPSSERGNYFVDSLFTGNATLPPGEKVETAFTVDLVAHVDATYPTIANRNGRALGGFSMGGYGAMRYLLAHPDIFRAAIVLSPAVYYPLPPLDSSTREFGAFGNGSLVFDEQIYIQKNYTSTFPIFQAANVPANMFIAVGDDEWPNPNAEDWPHDLDYEAHTLYNKARRVSNLSTELRVYNGGHGWDVWRPGFIEGAQYAFKYLAKPSSRIFLPIVGGGDVPSPTPTPSVSPTVSPTPSPTPTILNDVIGSDGEDVSAGVATDLAGNIYHAIGIAGSFEGLPYAGSTDVLVVKYTRFGQRLWARQFGTSATDMPWAVAVDAQGNVFVAGYTKGDLDGAHAGNTRDDIFVAKLGPDGTRLWTKQVGDPNAADRAYGVATDASGSVYAGGYTKGNLAGTNAGDKDVVIVKFTALGVQEWAAQFGGPAEEKAWVVATDAVGNAYLTGPTGGDLAGQVGGYDAFVARYSVTGTQTLLTQVGTTQDDDATGIAVAANGMIYLTGGTAGAFTGASAGDNDIFVAQLTAAGAVSGTAQIGTTGNEKGATVALDASGNVYVSSFTNGDLTGSGAMGKFDSVLMKFNADLVRQWTRQFGTVENDGAYDWAEPNLYIATYADSIYLAGLTGGNFYSYSNLGSTDVFLTEYRADGSGGPAVKGPPVKDVIGSDGEDVSAGVAVDRAGNIYQAIGIAGSFEGQTYAGSTDVLVIKYTRSGQRLWAQQFGTSATDMPWAVAVDAQGNVFVAGYTKGDLDGAHPGNTRDDIFVAKLGPDGTRLWTKQVGDPNAADRAYAVTTDGSGNVYGGGYTRGNLGGSNVGDKDIVVVKFTAAGVQEWVQQFGSAGEDKAYGLDSDAAGNIYVGGLVGADLAGQVGGYDGFIARYTVTGTQTLVEQFGTAQDDEVWGLAVAPSGLIYITGGTAGALSGGNAGENDIFVAQLSATGGISRSAQVGTTGNEKGASVALDASGNVYVSAFTNGDLTGSGAMGKFDSVLMKFNADLVRQWTRQFGTVENDGAYDWAEPNLYIATYADSIYLAGLTGGNFYGYTNLGSTDVFLTEYRADGSGGLQ